ncbi:MAG: TauD/TfdA family dioxygenase [Bryobacterales bacterium]|nr:TauD/TfdA family dioxygenase [Bryobacterales bacterium]MBV9398414.1 TauD/TfdA family dioxygenase [Bryobacterales bacterium]
MPPFERCRCRFPVLRKEGSFIGFEQLSYDADRVSIVWKDGSAGEFHSLWLRDNDPVNRDGRTGQRLIDVADLPLDVQIERAVPAKNALRVFWTDFVAAEFPLEWLREQSCCSAIAPAPELWRTDHGCLLHRFCYQKIRDSPKCRLDWLRAIATRGIAFLENVPPFDGQTLEIASLIGWVRETNYGRVFDVRAVPNANNLAYTERALGLHTDNPYRDPVPGLQVLHALKAGKGGESLFADGFAIADHLRENDPGAFEILSSTSVRFEFADAQTRLAAERSIIELDREHDLSAIHYNSRSIAALRLPACKVEPFYRAYRVFALRLRDTIFVATTALREGEAVIFDNRRVLHGRAAFAGDTSRHLQGCYLERDGLFSNLALLEQECKG